MGLVNLNVIKTINEKIFFLANPNKEIVSAINNISNKQATFKFNGYDEISFTITKKDDTLIFKNDIIDNTLLYIEDIGYFHFLEPDLDIDEDGNMTLSCTAYSAEYELTQRKLFSFYINTGEVGSIGDMTDGYVTFYNADNPNISLMHLVLEKFPTWGIGHVDATLINQQRTFSVDGTSVYDFLTNDVAATLQCVFIFDTINNLINVYDLNDKERELNPPFGANTNIYISQQNLATAVELSPLSSTDITTAVRIRGADDLDIRDANCGFDYMYNLSYYYPTMTDSTKTKWIQYLADWESKLDEYSDTISDANAISSEITKKKYTDYPSSTASTSDYTQYALVYLEQLLEYVQAEIDSCDASYYDKTNPDYSADKQQIYNGYVTDKQNIQTAIDNKNSEIALLTEQYNQAMEIPNSITQSLEFENYFTVSELEEIIPLIKEGDYCDSNYAVYDNYTPAQILTKKQQFRSEVVNVISELSQPQYSVSTSISNLFNLDEFKNWWDTFQLGDFFTVIFDNDYNIKQRLITVKISDFEDIQSLDVEYSNMTKSTLGISDINALLDTTASTSSVSSSTSSSSATSTDDDYVTTTELNTALINAGLGSGAAFNAQQLSLLQRLVEGKFDTLSGNYLTVEDFIAENGIIKILDSNIVTTDYGDINYLTSESAIIEDLTSKVSKTDELIFGSAGGTVIQTEFSNAVIAQLGDAQIKSAMIDSVSAEKITAGEIYTNLVGIFGDASKKLSIVDNTISISDGTQVRVQVGEDGNGDYNIYIWDANGNLLFNATGVTEDGLNDGIIKDIAVATDANISASKLNIESLFTVINSDTSHTLNSSKVLIDADNQTLDIAFKSLTTDVEELGTTVTSQGTSITTIQGQISSKIWQQDIDTSTETLQTQFSELSQDLSGFKAIVSDTYATKTEFETEISTVSTIATQTATKFDWLVQSAESESSIVMTDTAITAIADKLLVTGDMIVDGSITADKINVASLNAISANLGGFTIEGNKIVFLENSVYTKYTTVDEYVDIQTYWYSFGINPAIYTADDKTIWAGAHPSVMGTGLDDNNYYTDNSLTYPFYVTAGGTVHMEQADIVGGKIGGWTITSTKIYGGDSTTGVAAVQYPRDGMTWVFAAGGTSHSNYTDCPFRVSKAGKLYATDAEIAGKITATSGTIGGWTISSTKLSAFDGGWGGITYDDLETIKSYIAGSTTLNTPKLAYYDFNGDGVVDLYDFAIAKNYLLKGEINSEYVDTNSTISVTLSPSANEEIVKISARRMGGALSDVETSISAQKISTPLIQSSGASIGILSSSETHFEECNVSGTLAVTGKATFTGVVTGQRFTADNAGGFFIYDSEGTARTAINLTSANLYQIAAGSISNTIRLGSSYTTETNIYGTAITLSGTATSRKIAPSANNTYTCGADAARWSSTYTATISLGLQTCTERAANISSRWADGAGHDMIVRETNGLNLNVGWVGTSDYNTVTTLRGRYVVLNGGVGTYLKSTSGTAVTSDARMKQDIHDLEAYEKFYAALNPVSYKYTDGNSGRSHCGFVAQEVYQALLDSGLSTTDFGGYVERKLESEDEIAEYGYDNPKSLIYTEFIALNTHMIQKQQKEINSLKSEIQELKSLMNQLKSL